MKIQVFTLAIIIFVAYSSSIGKDNLRNLAWDDPFCSVWTNNGTTCTACSCHYYFNSLGKCTAVSDLCKTFDINTGKCLSCPKGSTLYNGVCGFGPIVPGQQQSYANPNCLTNNTDGTCKTCKDSTYTLHCGDCLAPAPTCFVGETIVKQRTRGFIEMKSLNIGDQIMTIKQGKQKWSKVEGWMHKDQHDVGPYRRLMIKTGQWIGVSAEHNIAFTHETKVYQYAFPGDKGIQGRNLYPSNATVVSTQQYVWYGKYAPSTSQYSYLVYTPKTFTPILAHDFAYVRHPQSLQLVADIFFGVGKFLNGGKINDENGINVVAKWTVSYFDWLIV